ncbi:hypothetical protein [Micromonospora sp. NPDC005237]|uniref:hypothetical protein n=1 Tax=Micromonospora sp. NPDC005237 TaxID=3155113 RepID=UPI0033AC9DE3
MARRLDVTNRPEAQLLSVYREHGVVPKSSREDNFNKPSDDLTAYRFVRPGNLVLNKMKTWQGSLAVSEFEGIVSPAYIVCSLSQDVHPRFAHYLLRSAPYVHLYQCLSKGIRPNQWDLPFDEFRKVPLVLPPIDEQRRIASFLDEQGGRYDELIRQRQRQEELLAARRTTVVDDAMRQAGPADYKLFRALRVLRDGSHQPPPRVDAGVPLLTARNVSSGVLRLTESDTHVSDADAREMERSLAMVPGDVLLTVKGTIGASAVVPVGFPRAVLDRNIALLRTGPSLTPEWLMYALRSTILQDQMRVSVNFAAQPGLPLGLIRELRLPVPSPTAQRKLTVAIEAQYEWMDGLINFISRHVRLLSERRQALITEAVTGQIDVTTARGVEA